MRSTTPATSDRSRCGAMAERLLTAGQVVRRLEHVHGILVDRSTVYRWWRAGRLPERGTYRITASELDDWIRPKRRPRRAATRRRTKGGRASAKG